MALTAKQIKELKIGMAYNSAGANLLTSIDASTALTAGQLRHLKIALGDIAAANEVAAAIAAPATTTLSVRTQTILRSLMSTPVDGAALVLEINSN